MSPPPSSVLVLIQSAMVAMEVPVPFCANHDEIPSMHAMSVKNSAVGYVEDPLLIVGRQSEP